jgi:hypothetical protein
MVYVSVLYILRYGLEALSSEPEKIGVNVLIWG